MSWRTTPAEAKALSAKIAKAAENKRRDELLEMYRVYRSEARACGYEVETFNEYCQMMKGA